MSKTGLIPEMDKPVCHCSTGVASPFAHSKGAGVKCHPDPPLPHDTTLWP